MISAHLKFIWKYCGPWFSLGLDVDGVTQTVCQLLPSSWRGTNVTDSWRAIIGLLRCWRRWWPVLSRASNALDDSGHWGGVTVVLLKGHSLTGTQCDVDFFSLVILLYMYLIIIPCVCCYTWSTLYSLGEGAVVTKSNYWQIPLAEEHRWLTAFVTHDSFYEWLRMPFKLKNAGATFFPCCSIDAATHSWFCRLLCWRYWGGLARLGKPFVPHP